MKLTFTTSSEGQAVLAGATVTVWHWASCPLPGRMLLINGPEEDDCTRETEVWETSLWGPAQRECSVNHHRCFHVTFFFSDWQSCCSCAKTGCSAFGRLRVTCSQSWGCAGCRGLRALTCMAKRKPKGQVLTQVGRLVPWALLTSLPFSQEGKGHYFPVLRCRSLRGERLGRVYEIPREGQDLPVSSCSLPATSLPWLPWPPTNQAVCSITYQQYINYTLELLPYVYNVIMPINCV